MTAYIRPMKSLDDLDKFMEEMKEEGKTDPDYDLGKEFASAIKKLEKSERDTKYQK